MRKLTQPVGLTGNRDWDVGVVNSTRIVLTPSPSGVAKTLKDAMGVARDVVRRRIDPSGTKEITVVTEGGNRILVEVPGVEDPEALKRLIGQTARLEFKLIDPSANPQEVQQGHAPPGSQVLPLADGSGFMAVKRRVIVNGDQIVKATQSYDQDGRPDIEIGFNTAGARRFGRVAQENVGKLFAIILDDKILSAPVINEPILGGNAVKSTAISRSRARTTSRCRLRQANCRSKLDPIEERTISAELGQDSINKGAIASGIAVLGVIIFMLVTYGRFEVYANIALVVNAFLILGIMAMFNATLTLPGSQVHPDDRRRGRRQRADQRANTRGNPAEGGGCSMPSRPAIAKPYRAIFDANVTHVISATVMAYFGTGPVRGFAIVLLIGVVTSVLHRRLFHPDAGGALDPPRPSARAAHLRLIFQ